jgi:hypothetical protein
MLARPRAREEMRRLVEAANRAILRVNIEAPTDRQQRRPLDMELELERLERATLSEPPSTAWTRPSAAAEEALQPAHEPAGALLGGVRSLLGIAPGVVRDVFRGVGGSVDRTTRAAGGIARRVTDFIRRPGSRVGRRVGGLIDSVFRGTHGIT